LFLVNIFGKSMVKSKNQLQFRRQFLSNRSFQQGEINSEVKTARWPYGALPVLVQRL
jgi:hypothetical protein